MTVTALLLHHAAGSAHLGLFGLFTKWMWDSAVAQCWTQPPVIKPCSRFDLLLPYRQAAESKSPCCSPCPVASAAFSQCLSILEPGLSPTAQVTCTGCSQHSFRQTHWHDRAGGALVHVILPLLGAALTPCAGRMHGWWQQCPCPCGRGFHGFASR